MDTRSIEKIIKRLENLDRKNGVEVEDILRLTKTGDASLIAPLKALAVKQGWKPLPAFPKVPLAGWVDAVCCYFADGIPGLCAVLANKDAFFSLALSVMATLARQESVEALVDCLDNLDLSEEKDAPFLREFISTLAQAKFIKDLHLSPATSAKAIAHLKEVIAYAEKGRITP
ncbi:MAG: hypothetical protein LBS89_05030 [Zoogloeaceae bacterium]|jgi:hypothetical protein|nr:hypothetical protein [Zoogloeaceae bacterium]